MAKTSTGELGGLCAQLKQWRERGGGGRGKRIPEKHWKRAAEVARVIGVEITARATRLHVGRLRQRMQESGGADRVVLRDVEPVRGERTHRKATGPRTLRASRAEGTEAARFVAVQLPAAASVDTFTVELVGCRGGRMRVQTTAAVDMVGLMQAFWSTQP